MQMILQNISLILIYLSVHSLIKAFKLSSRVILQNIEFFSFSFCYHVVGLLNFLGFYLNYYYHFFKDKLKKKSTLFVLKNSFNNSVYMIALNLVSLLLKPTREFPIEDFSACLTNSHSS